MTISIDLDSTWTRDPQLWRMFHAQCKHRGHKLIMVTGRSGPGSDMVRFDIPHDIPIIYADRELKEHAARKAGYTVDIWIDDMPGTIQECAIIQPSEDKEL